MRLEGTAQALRSPYPWTALGACVLLTAAAWIGIERDRREEARVQFERRTETAVAAIRARMLAYEQILRSGAARLASSPDVSREEWGSFIAHLQLDERFPGIEAIGFAEHRRASTRDESVVVAYNEPPTSRNLRALGLDLYADPVRRAAIERARDTGETAISARLAVSGESLGMLLPQQPGFMMVVPIFHDVARDLPRHERRRAVRGYVFSPFRMQDLLRGILDDGVLQVLDMRIYDEPGGALQAELIDTRTAWRAQPASARAEFQRIVHFPMPSRAWTIQFVSRPEFDAALRAGRPWIVLAFGTLGSVAVFLLITALVEAWEHARNLSMRDPLTGLFNRRYLDETMAREVPRARRLRQALGILVIDLDHFKQLNDTFGHEAGDFVLARTGELLRGATRAGDIACRLGGEEFAVVMTGTPLEVACERADALRAAYATLTYDFEGTRIGPFTLSAGVAAVSPAQPDWAAAMRDADRALYAAKQGGRNRVVRADQPAKA